MVAQFSTGILAHFSISIYKLCIRKRIKHDAMNWIILIVAGLFETGFAFCLGKMKEATGAEYCWWGTGFLLSLALSMTLLAKATQSLPIGTAYPVWTGIGAVGTVLAGILFLNEPATFPRIFFLLLLIGAIVGLKLVGEPH